MWKKLMLAMAMVGAMTLVAGPALAGKAKAPADKAKVEQKCDKAGKPCTKGKDCKADNCKKEPPAPTAPADDMGDDEGDPGEDE